MSAHSSRFIVRLQRVDIVSLLGLFFSCLAVVLSAKGLLAYSLATLLLGMLCDAYDGWVARKLNQQRDFGRYLDGGIDVIMHLFAPAFFFYQWGMTTWYYLVVLFLVIASGIVRLAVFNEIGNIKASNKLKYLGTPVFWFPFIAVFFFLLGSLFRPEHLYPLVASVLLVFAFLMVYRKERYKPGNLAGITFILLSVIALLFLWPHFPASFFEWFGLIFLLSLPAGIGGALHMLFARFDWLCFLKKPIKASWFGENKTWRGVFLMTLFVLLGFLFARWIEPYLSPPLAYSLNDVSLFPISLLLGAAFVLGELPNSFIKRRLGIKPGELPIRYRILVIIGDQIDSGLPVAVVYFIYLKMSWNEFFIFMPGLILSFFFWRVLLAAVRLKSSALR